MCKQRCISATEQTTRNDFQTLFLSTRFRIRIFYNAEYDIEIHVGPDVFHYEHYMLSEKRA